MKMYNRNTVLAISLIVLIGLLLVVTPQQTTAKFVLASWDYPDEYGQGLYMYYVMENITEEEWTPVGVTRYYNESGYYNWTVGWFIKLRIYAFMNSTLTGASTLNEGQNYQRLNVTVTTDANLTAIFSQNNLTCFYNSSYFDPILWLYGYEVVLNFYPDFGHIYIVTITHEVFYGV